MIHEQKAAVRKVIEEKRKQLDAEEITRSDRRIMRNLLALPGYRQAKVIFCFVGTAQEIDTRPMILDALAHNKRVCVPRCISKGVMKAYEITSLDDLQLGKYNILEPKEYCEYVDTTEIDFVVVPCVTCNTKGHRLGYGGGFYDRYLEKQSFITAVLCRSSLLYEEIPMDSHDAVIHIVVTDQLGPGQ